MHNKYRLFLFLLFCLMNLRVSSQVNDFILQPAAIDTINYKAGGYSGIRSCSAGKSIILHYADGRLKEVSRGGNIFDYFIDSSLVDKIVRLHGGEEMYHLTRMAVPENMRYSVYITDYFKKDDTLFLLINFQAALKYGNDTAVKKVYTLLTYRNQELLTINPILADLRLIENYILMGNSFFKSKNRLVINISKDQRLRSLEKDSSIQMCFLANFKLDKLDRYVFDGLHKDKLPQEYIKYGFMYTVPVMIKSYPYYIMPASNALRGINERNEQQIKNLFSIKLDSTTHPILNFRKRFIVDLNVSENTVALITSENSVYSYKVYDYNKMEMTFSKILWPMNPGNPIPVLDRTNKDKLLLVTKDGLWGYRLENK